MRAYIHMQAQVLRVHAWATTFMKLLPLFLHLEAQEVIYFFTKLEWVIVSWYVPGKQP